jgi:hypothetical protein
VVVTAIKGGLVLAVEFIGFQDHLVQLQKRLRMPYRHIPVNAVIFFQINPEFQYRHGYKSILSSQDT